MILLSRRRRSLQYAEYESFSCSKTEIQKFLEKSIRRYQSKINSYAIEPKKQNNINSPSFSHQSLYLFLILASSDISLQVRLDQIHTFWITVSLFDSESNRGFNQTCSSKALTLRPNLIRSVIILMTVVSYQLHERWDNLNWV